MQKKSTDAASPVGLIGLGLLGSAMGARFIAAGLRVAGYDIVEARRREFESAGGDVANSASDVMARCGRIVLSLPDSAVSRAVLRENADALTAGSLVIDTTTGEPDEMEALAATLEGRGIGYLDATVGGSSEEVRRRDVTVMVGGDRQAFEECRDLFDAFARTTFYLGVAGSGARMKLVVNLVLGLNRAALAEGLGLAQAYGFDLAETLDVLKEGPSYSRAMDAKGKKMLTRDFAPQARLSQHLKDVRIILSEGMRLGAFLPLSTLHRGLLEEVEAAGHGDMDNSAIATAFLQIS